MKQEEDLSVVLSKKKTLVRFSADRSTSLACQVNKNNYVPALTPTPLSGPCPPIFFGKNALLCMCTRAHFGACVLERTFWRMHNRAHTQPALCPAWLPRAPGWVGPALLGGAKLLAPQESGKQSISCSGEN